MLNMKNNKNLYSIRPFLSQKYCQIKSSLRSPLYKSMYNKINFNNIPKKKVNNIYKDNKMNINNEYFDILSEKVFNLYDLADTIKSNHNNGINTINTMNVKNKNLQYYINNSTRSYINNDNNKKNIDIQKRINNELNISNNSLKKILLKNPFNNKNIMNKNQNNHNKKSYIKKNRNIINLISPKNINIPNNINFNSFNNYFSENGKNDFTKNNKIISNYKYYFKEKNVHNLNNSPIGQFDNYFYNSNKLDKKRLLNNQILITNSININKDMNNLNKKLTIESPTSLSYHSYIRKNSQREMSIEHNIEYDINNINSSNSNQKYAYFNSNEFNRYKRNDIFSNKDDVDDYKLKTENNNSNYNNQNYKTINFDINPILYFKKYKFKSATVNRLIKDYFFKNNENDNYENNENETNLKKNNDIGDKEYIEEIIDNKENELKEIPENNNKQNKKMINKKQNIKNIEIAKKLKKLIKNNKGKILESIKENKENKENKKNNNQKLLNDKKGKKISAIPFDKNNKKYNTIENFIKKQRQKNLFNSSISLKNKKNLKENNSSLGKSEKRIYCKYISFPIEEFNSNALQTMENLYPKACTNQKINKKRIKNNNSINKNINKVFNNVREILLSSKKNERIKTENSLH